MALYKDTTKEWISLAARDLNPLCISYKPNINNMAIQGESNRAGSWIAMGGQGAKGQATVPDKSRVGVSIHGFGKWLTSALFDMQIVNLDAVS